MCKLVKQGGGKGKKTGKIFVEIMTQNFQNVVNDLNLLIL